MTKRAAVYVRISQDRAGAGLGVERQRDDCLALAAQLGWTVAATHVDNDLSAYSGKPRPAYRALLDDLEQRRADAVLVWHTDRLHRSPRELEEYVDVCERHKIVTQTVQAGELDLATPSGRAVARTLGAWARFEVEHKSERTRRAQLQAAQAGRWLGGSPRPFGWRVSSDGSAVLEPVETAAVQEATTALLAGASIGSLIRDWNARGLRTSTGKTWQHATVVQVLTRPRNAGRSTYAREVVGRSQWPALVTEDAYDALVALLADPTRRSGTTNRVRHLLAGLALCGVCGSTVRTATTTSNRRTGLTRTIYRCRVPGGGHIARSTTPVDDLVRRVVSARLARPDVLDLLRPDDGQATADETRAARDEAVAVHRRLEEVAEAFADGTVTRSQLERATAKLRQRLEELDALTARAGGAGALPALIAGGAPADAWPGLPLDRQRAVIAELMTVTIEPSGRRGKDFDPTLVRIDWRRSA